MDDSEREQALLTALTTEHFVLQTSRGATIAESVGRATVFLTLLSAALVGLGFVSSSEQLVRPYLGAVLPTLIVTGVLTFLRLVDTMVENSLALQRVQRIRRYYHRRFGAGHDFFADAADEDVARSAWRAVGGSPGKRQLLLTTGAMIGAVDALLMGAGAALLLGLAVNPAAAVVTGVVTAVVSFGVHFWYINRRAVSGV